MRAVGRATVRSFFGRDDWLGSADASVTSRRFYAMMQASWLGMSQFIFGVVLFAWWSAWPLVAASLIAIVAWSVNMVLARRGQLLRSAGIVHLTVCSMAAVVVVYIGWDLGWQYALIVQMLVCILNPWPRRAAVLLAATAAVLFLGLYYYTQRTEPLVSVAPAVLDVLGTAIALGALGVACVMVNYPVIAADQAEAALAQEHDRSERLLANVLPRPVAARLKAGEEPITDAVPSASVLFADIVDFTPLASRLPPGEVVTLLDGVFSSLDELVDEHGLEKIKTIGDAYMVAAGIPTPRRDHAEALARFALAARDRFAAAPDRTPRLQMRIGLCSGPVVAGVIGRRRFLYDLWGDTVNTASRMESHGVPGRIQVDDATRFALGDAFRFAERGTIEVKGKGHVHTWFLLEQKPQHEAAHVRAR